MYLACSFFLVKNSFFTPSVHYTKGLSFLILIFANFDGAHYIEVARNGYHDFLYPFFPFYPLLVKITTPYLFKSHIISGEVISHIFFFAACLVVYKLLHLDKKNNLFVIFMAIVLFFPSSFFYGAVYNDSLFFFFATLTIYFSRRKKWILASFAGALATYTRLNGLALIFLIFLEYIQSFNKDKDLWNIRDSKKAFITAFSFRNIFHSGIVAIILIPFAFLSFLAYIHISYGGWSLVFSSMKQWDQDKIIFPLQVFWRYYKILVLYPTFNISYLVALNEQFSVIMYLVGITYSFKKIRLSYWIFFVISIIIPSLTGTFQGMPRYGLHLYPFFLSFVLILSNRGKIFKFLYFAISLTIAFFSIILFTSGFFIA